MLDLTRYYVAANPNTPSHVLEQLAKDENSDVRHYVARNPNTPTTILVLLATDKNYWVRYWVAHNPNTPIYIRFYIDYKKYLNLL